MWPWEHAAVGYLLYSLARRAQGREPPTESATGVLVGATVLPDLVDKPLSWGLGWVPSGYAVAHSLFVAVPLAVTALALGRRFGRRSLGVAFVVGYLSHLLGDILNPLRAGDQPDIDRVLWPVVDVPPYSVDRGLERGLFYLQEFLAGLPDMEPLNIVLVAVIPALTAVVWLLDGAPGTAVPRRLVRAVRRRRS